MRGFSTSTTLKYATTRTNAPVAAYKYSPDHRKRPADGRHGADHRPDHRAGERRANARQDTQNTRSQSRDRQGRDHPLDARCRRMLERVDFFFDGQAKTRGAVTAQTAPYPIPVLADPQLVLDAFARLRDSYDCSNLSNEQVHNRMSKTLNGYVAQFFSGDAGTAMMPKDLRAAYATIAWEWFAPPHIAQSAYFARILGHSELGLVAVQSYIDFYPLGHKRDFQRAYRAGRRDAINQLAQLTQAETDERKRLLLDERRAQFQTALQNNRVA
jgi:hypothetical protein